MKKGLVLEGGAMRGMFTCGVIDVMMENDIEYDGAVGISAGAVFGCNYKSRQKGRAIRYNIKYARDPRYCSIRSLIKTGDLYGAEFCYHELPDKLDIFDRKAFKENPMEFYVGATDVKSGECVFHKCTDGYDEDISWMQASASMPLVSRTVEIGENKLLDGGISDAIPYKYMQSIGYDKLVIVLTRPLDYVKKPADPRLIRLIKIKYPAVAEAMKRRHIMYNSQTQEIRALELDNSVFVIRPPMDLHIKRSENDPFELERVYTVGRWAGMQRIDDLKKYFLQE